METINTNKSKVVTRSYTDDSQVIASSFPRSSFNNTYHNAFDGIIGRIIPAAVFDVLPKTQFQGVNSGSVFLERMVTPIMPDTTAHSYNFYCSCRAVDRDYQDLASPSVANGMAQSGSFPMFSTPELAVALFEYITRRYASQCGFSGTYSYSAWWTILRNALSDTVITAAQVNAVIGDYGDYQNPSECLQYWPTVYLTPLAYDFDQYFSSFLADESAASIGSAIGHTLARFLEYAVGAGSLLDHFGYFIVDVPGLRFEAPTTASGLRSAFEKHTYSSSQDVLQTNEYRLRMNAAVWIEYFRQPQLQKMNSALRYNRWDSESILGTASSSGVTYFRKHAPEAMLLLFMRAVPFAEDRVTTAHVDDICRNVYAPIVNVTDGKYGAINNDPVSQQLGTDNNNLHEGFASLQLAYSKDGERTTINCPVPSMVGNFMARVNSVTANKNALMLDLQTLKTAELLSRELKRRYWFGDSYFDVVRADYDCDISDADVLKPHLLGDGGVCPIGVSQEVASTDGTDSPRGTRTAVGTGEMPNDPYSGFAQETGCVFNLVYLSQRVSYDPADDFNVVRTYTDMIKPIYAATNESILHKYAVNRHANSAHEGFGFEPYGNYYRTRLDRAHGKFLREYKDYIALRDSNNVKLHSDYLMQYQLPLGHFADTIMLDGQFYVLGTHKFFATHSLPAPVEII